MEIVSNKRGLEVLEELVFLKERVIIGINIKISEKKEKVEDTSTYNNRGRFLGNLNWSLLF